MKHKPFRSDLRDCTSREPKPELIRPRVGDVQTLRPGTKPRHGKGKPEGPAVTGKARKPRVAETDLVSEEAAGQNNSNLTS
jgi:hypothetical protein